MDCHVQHLTWFCLGNNFSGTIWNDVTVSMSLKLVPTESNLKKELKPSHKARTKGRDQSRPVQPKSGNTQLDECLICQKSRRTGVNFLQVRALFLHPQRVYIRCNGLTKRPAPHLRGKPLLCPYSTLCSEPCQPWMTGFILVSPGSLNKKHVMLGARMTNSSYPFSPKGFFSCHLKCFLPFEMLPHLSF